MQIVSALLLTHLLVARASSPTDAQDVDDSSIVHRQLDDTEPTFVGCFSDDEEDRDLPHYIGRNVPVEECQAACVSYGYQFYGRQSGEECWCGKEFGKHGPAEGCDCDNNLIGQFQQCVYDLGHTARRLGCWADVEGDRALPIYMGRGLTFKQCADECTNLGTAIFGRESWGECWCGEPHRYQIHGRAEGCNCNDRNIGQRKMCTYELVDYMGCYADTRETRALEYKAPGRDYTYNQCRDICHSKGYHFMGRQARRECWCGGASPEDKTYEANGATTGCLCESDANVGSWKMCVHRVFHASFKGCWKDTTDRGLTVYAGRGMSFDECNAACLDKGYHFMGRQSWGECWCGGNTDGFTAFEKHGPADTCHCENSRNIGAWKNCMYRVTQG